MWMPFLLENMHFAVNLFTALVFFAVFWLYYDASTVRREWKELIKLIGLFLLSLSFVATAVTGNDARHPGFHGNYAGISEYDAESRVC